MLGFTNSHTQKLNENIYIYIYSFNWQKHFLTSEHGKLHTRFKGDNCVLPYQYFTAVARHRYNVVLSSGSSTSKRKINKSTYITIKGNEYINIFVFGLVVCHIYFTTLVAENWEEPLGYPEDYLQVARKRSNYM